MTGATGATVVTATVGTVVCAKVGCVVTATVGARELAPELGLAVLKYDGVDVTAVVGTVVAAIGDVDGEFVVPVVTATVG